jgi:hypothetical protein
MELPTPVASRTWRKPTGFRENAARAFAREPHWRDDPTKAGEFDWDPHSEIPRITLPSPRSCNRLLRKYPIRSRRRARFDIPRVGKRMQVTNHLHGEHLGEALLKLLQP